VTPTCQWEDLPSCDAVLALDAEGDLGVHSQPDILPVCLRTLRASTEQFVKRRYTSSPLIDRWAHTWPLPVGKQALLDWFRDEVTTTLMWSMPHSERECLGSPEWRRLINAQLTHEVRGVYQRNPPEFLTEKQRQRLSSLRVEELPTVDTLQDSDQAGLIVERRTANGQVTLLGLVRAAPDEEVTWTFSDPTVLMAYAGGNDDVLARAKAITRSYQKHLLGQRVRSGGPKPGNGLVDRITVEAVCNVYEDLLSHYSRPQVQDVADALVVSKHTLERFTGKHRLRWPPSRKRWPAAPIE